MTVDGSHAFLGNLIKKRKKLIDALNANRGEVNLDIFEDFYPDRAHFVYELLQNAEDAGATEISFTLEPDRLLCTHNGRMFSEADVAAITGIHNSTKDKSQDRIGKFGVGFKSVFVYTKSPIVRSGDFQFRIVEMILPEVLPHSKIGTQTIFEFPFDNPAKSAKEAHREIEQGLRDLDETTLLFLSNLQSIHWFSGAAEGHVSRQARPDFHFEISCRSGESSVSSVHFLKFEEAVPGFTTQRVAVAFPLDFLPGVRAFDPTKPLAEQMKIVPASQGSVSVFFVAAKETSGLLFHLHGPFVPELSRASIKDTAVNEPLFDQLGALGAHSLHRVRDLGLLTPDFLGILPNPQDQIPQRYQRIRTAIIEQLKNEPLTPTHDRSHAPANRLIQAKASLKNFLTANDVEFLVDYDDEPPLWAISASQRNSRIDNLLEGLDIREWGIDELVSTLQDKASNSTRYLSTAPYVLQGPDEDFMAWLGERSPEWLQQLYAILHDESAQSDLTKSLRNARIVRLHNANFGTASQSYFSADSDESRLPTVDVRVFTSGKSKPQQEKARKFLADLGVRELGEAEEIELILKTRYTDEAEIPDEKTYLRDLKRFVRLVEKQPEKSELFADYYVFQGADEQWYAPEGIYLDEPYRQTDLSAYFTRFGDDADRTALHPRYRDCGIAPKRISGFAEATGVCVDLPIAQVRCRNNPQWPYLRSVGGDRYTSPQDTDYDVPGLVELLKSPSLQLSRLLWRTLIAPDFHCLTATFRRNWSGGTNYASSQLVHTLRDTKWIPQGNGQFVSPADASSKLLPEGFPFDAGYEGLKAIEFGIAAERQSAQTREKDHAAKAAGFPNADALERAKRFAALPLDEQEKFFAEREKASKSAVPDREPATPERRAQNVAQQAENAPDKQTEMRSRSVSIGREDVKAEAEQYLLQHYRNSDGDMTCQICKGPLPFKLDDGTDFFEVVEFLPALQKRHYQNYLALCPNHSAMYRHANASLSVIQGMLESLATNELQVTLAQQDITIYLSSIHLIDLKAVLEVEGALPEAIPEEAVS
jgi:hypothetical protein